MKKLLFFCSILLFISCSVIMDGLVESANDGVAKIGAKEVHLLTLNKNDSLYYIKNEYGTFKYTGKNFIKYNNGNVKEKSKYNKGKKHGTWVWYTKSGKRIRNEIWEDGILISKKTF